MIDRKEMDIDITRNVKIIDWLKSQLLSDVADLFKCLVRGIKEEMRESIEDCISSIIVASYLLAKRLGVTYNSVELKIADKIRLGIIENHDVEKYYGDLSELSHHMKLNRGKDK